MKFNPFNRNQFFLGSQECLSIFDIREGKEIESLKLFGDCVDVFCDSVNYLITYKDGVRLFNKNNFEEKILFENKDLSFANICFYNDKFDCFISGNENGDFIYSINNNR